MSAYEFFLTNVTFTNDNATAQINNADSVFGAIEGSQVFVAGSDIPETLVSVDNTARTITLSRPWPRANAQNVEVKISPVASAAAQMSALESTRVAFTTLMEAIDNPAAGMEAAITEGLKYLDSQVAQSPAVEQRQNLTHRLIDYPTLKKTDVVPTESPNNKREMLFDDVRQRAYIALTESWLPIPNVIATREFLISSNNRGIKFNNNYTGDITYRVFPMGNGGQGLPDSPTINNFEWYEGTATVSSLGSFGMSFVGVIEFLETDHGFHRFSSAQSHFPSINAFYADNNGNVAPNQFREFSLRQDGHWYSSDITPDTPYSMGGSWSQDTENKRLFTVNNASDGSDALRFFSDGYDDYPLEVVVISNVNNAMAVTLSNSDPYVVYFSGTYVYLTNERLYFKRRAGYAPISGTVEIESIKIRVANYE